MTDNAENAESAGGAAHEPAEREDQAPDAAAEQQASATEEALRREAAENWERYLRAAAELDNFRKRSARELEVARKYGAERLAQGLLPVRDALEAALASADSVDLATLLEGERAILRLLDEALETAGVVQIDPRGQPFDPEKHEAMTLQPSAEVPPNTVLQVIQKGYQLHDRLLRPARVVVAKAPDA
ncbi:MAG TPA: nucleotide exchange factor GrpE [Gammaproteobacteria bacterium]